MEKNKDLAGRVDDLEKGFYAHETEIALLRQGQDAIKDELKGINQNTKWLVRLVLAGVIGGLLAMLFNGGAL